MLTYSLLAAAVTPAAALLVIVYKADRLEQEPPGILLRLLLCGTLSTGLAALTERFGANLLSRYMENTGTAYRLWMCFAVIAVSEEGFKYFFLKRKTWHSPQFNCQFDGVVYAVFISLGFALLENIDYVLQYGFSTAMIRSLTAVPGHACFGVFMGAWYSVARKYENRGQKTGSKICLVMAVLVPVLMHGAYDFIAMTNRGKYVWPFFVFVMGMFLATFVVIRRLAENDRYME